MPDQFYLRKAMELDPSSPVPALNLTLAMVGMGKVTEAETLARKTLVMVDQNVRRRC
ncbi:MAG: hypothetical protein HY820_32435 [Acidobacteria bacterium]|nr:hypothetical protein [Acidobacteriota bacterium]